MAKKQGRGRGKGRGKPKGDIGKRDFSPNLGVGIPSDPEFFADAIDPSDTNLELVNPDDHPELTTGPKDYLDEGCSDAPAIEIVDEVLVEDKDYHSVGEDSPSLPDDDLDVLPNVASVPKVESGDWASLFKTDRMMGSLHHFLPKKNGGKTFVYPPDDIVEEGISKWNSSLVGQFMDKPLPYFLVQKAVRLMWSQFGEVEVFSLENGMFIFRFQDVATCEEVLKSKLWHVSNKPLILRKWQPGMQVLKLTLTSVPVWVKFVHLPMEFWTPKCLSYVASGVGKPLYADKVIEDQKRLGFARVLVEIDINSDCPKEIIICKRNGDTIPIAVEYPWLPPKCSTCGGFGHAAYACAKREKEKLAS